MKKIFGKKFVLFTCMAAALFLFSCGDKPDTKETPETPETPAEQEPAEGEDTPDSPAYTITAKEGYADSITIDEEAGTITLAPADEKVEYTITGEFEGQIINKTKGTMIILDNAKLTNANGKAVIYGELKTEIKIKENSTNTIAVTGEADKTYGKAAVLCEKAIEIGGAGTCTISCENGHGVKASKIELKGSGNYTFDGGDDSSGINCNSFTVEQDEEKPRTFTAIFKDSKNGIKADETIEIGAGTFEFKNITGTALKTDKKDKEGAEPADHFIHLTGGTFSFADDCAAKYETKKDSFTKTDAVNGNFD